MKREAIEQQRGRKWLSLCLLALTVTGLFFAQVWGHAGAQSTGAVKLAEFRGPVTAILARYIDNAISGAEAGQAAALVIELDTPGGDLNLTKDITQRMTSATIPVVVYVAPRGAHAGSAGTFITLAGHVAAMAPGTSIGAASPVDSSGGDLPATEKAKLTNVLVADITNLAARRGPKAADWAARAVSQAAAATADEALQLGVIDAVANDVPDLLRQLDGRTVIVAGQPVKLQLSDRPVEQVPLSPFEDFLNAITNPAIATILLTIGLNALLFEISSPGATLPGIIGATCLLLALYALGTLNANWVGLGFVVLAFVLFVLDIKAPTHGVLSVAGVGSFILGAFLLFNVPGLAVPWATIIVVALLTAGFFAFAIAKAIAIQRRKPVTGMEGLVGQIGHVRQPLEPAGLVLVEGELWRAESEAGPVTAGGQVLITGYQGFKLRVRPVKSELPAGTAAKPELSTGKPAASIEQHPV
jgi:membrane-bound serine protease (ClpP class)